MGVDCGLQGTLQIRQIVVNTSKGDEMIDMKDLYTGLVSKPWKNQNEFNEPVNVYQSLFELVPCIITVQDHNYKLIQYNREFAEKFRPNPGDYCYAAYKRRDKKCEICPVEQTFKDGSPHYSEEAGVNKDGTRTYWIVKTAPIVDANGKIVAAMEMSLDITHKKLLEEKLKKSEKKYYAIFHNIPNPVFVLDAKTLKILDCNESVKAVYGFDKNEMIQTSFLSLFMDEKQNHDALKSKTPKNIYRAKQVNHEGETLHVNIRISPFEYQGRSALLITTSDITKQLEAEQQLIQASKMATLGEMATGVAHELNQPLSVIKTASRFFMKKIGRKEPIHDEILLTMAGEIDSHVDRATKIINRMRQFGRKTDMILEKIDVNQILKKGWEILGQQLKARGIEVIWRLQDRLPGIMADPDRLEQVFINLLINARDALEAGGGRTVQTGDPKRITLETGLEKESVVVVISDTGIGIPQEHLERIFEPFFTTKSAGQGTGLGLSISYGIIRECGGEIMAAPNPNGGARFIMRFPMAGKDS